MNATVTRASLASALATVAPASNRRPWSTLPILANVLLDARSDGLWLICTNLDTVIERRIDAEVVETGATTAPVSALRRMVEYLDATDVALTTPPGKPVLTARSGARTFSLRGLPAEEWPTRNPIIQSAAIGLDRRELRGALQRVAVAMARDESRPALTGVLLKLVGSELLLIAADSFRLHIDRLHVESDVEFDLILPAEAVRHLVRLLAGGGDVKLVMGVDSVTGNDVRFDLGDAALTSRAIEAKYPNYEAIIPAHHETRATVDRRRLLSAVKLADVIARDANNLLKMQVRSNCLTLSAKADDVGEVSDEIPCQVEGPAIPIALNTQLLIEVLSVLTTDVAVFDLTTPAQAVVIGGPHVAFQAVVMPMHTAESREYKREAVAA